VAYQRVDPMSSDCEGWFAQLSPGLSGGKVSVGFGMGALPGICGFGTADSPYPAFFGYEVKASYLKTWWPRLNGIPAESLIGLEAGGIFVANLNPGVFEAIDGPHGSRRTRFSIGAGIGF
jgi:hypothetical protein